MDKIKIIKAITGDYYLKEERNARIRDSKLNKLVYYDGHIELVNDTIDEITLCQLPSPKGRGTRVMSV